jgi:hypothetical protein
MVNFNIVIKTKIFRAHQDSGLITARIPEYHKIVFALPCHQDTMSPLKEGIVIQMMIMTMMVFFREICFLDPGDKNLSTGLA